MLGLLSRLFSKEDKKNRKKKVLARIMGSTPIEWFFENGLEEALPCFFSARGASRVLLVVAPCDGGRLPRRLRRLEAVLKRCDYRWCSGVEGKPYPENPSVARCMVVGEGEDCRVVYVEDYARR